MESRGALGEFIRSERTRKMMSQGDLAKLSGVRRDYVGSLELGRISVIYPETFQRLKSALGFPGWACLESMGFETDVGGVDILPELAATIATLDAGQQRSLMTFLESVRRSGKEELDGTG